MTTLAALHRYPVKSMMGEELNAARITPRGLFGDRHFALCDTETKKIASTKNPRKWPTLFSFRASFAASPEDESPLPAVRVTLPDGTHVTTTNPEFAATLSNSLGRSVSLLAAPPPNAPPHQLEEYWPDIDGLAHRDHVTDEAMPPGTFFDLALLHLLTTSTLDELRTHYPEGRFEPRRFRPNLILNTAGQKGFIENDWIGKTLAIGPEVKLQITGPCPRCVMTTLAQGDLPKDPGILKTAAKYNEVRVGIYAAVLTPGTIRINDSVTVL